MVHCVALVVAAGRGSRLGGPIAKQWLDLDGRPLLRHSLETLAAHSMVDGVRVVIHPDDHDRYAQATRGLALGQPIEGGETRQESVRLGLEALADDPPDLVLIHDGARPFVDGDLIARVIEVLENHHGAIPALRVHDTIKREREGLVAGTIPRDGLWLVQTPQGFRFADILEAHRAARGLQLTDDSAVAERAGLRVAIVAGSEDNVKITTPSDLERASEIARRSGEVCVGMGYDVHRFAPGTEVILCGVRIPHDRRLEGHSDADVGLHAATDAILGAIGAGDIGRHFPPSDARWRGADSSLFLARAGELAGAAGASLLHLDVTIICERPNIAPHAAAMTARLAAILAVDPGRISVKATTTDGLGFTGRAEGIAAQAVATLRMPRRSPR